MRALDGARELGELGFQAANGFPWGWGSPSPTASRDGRVQEAGRQRKDPLSVPKFIKKLEEIPEIALPETTSVKIALALSERGIVGQFMGL